ncbi:MAG: hypothetical protein IIY16_02550 [Oscillospiraceae bacterium]|nr:hypothetical protein [Oscillospiraceae bacterium]
MSVNERGKVLHLHPDDGEQPKKKNPVGRVILLSFVLLLAAAAVCFLYLRSGLREGGAANRESAGYVFEEGRAFCAHRGGIAAVTAGGFSVYDALGNTLGTAQHVYSVPVVRSGGLYALAFDVGGTRLSVLNERGETVLDRESEGTLLDADISSGGAVCLAELLTGYRTVISVFDNRQNEIYRYYSASRYLAQCAVSEDGQYLCAAALGSSGSRYESTAVIFRTDAQEALFELPLGDELVRDLRFVGEETLCAVLENSVVLFNLQGERLGSFDCGESYLRDCSLDGGGFIALSLNKYQAGSRYSVALLDLQGNCLAEQYLGEEILSLSCSGDRCAVLTSGALYIYDQNLNLIASTGEAKAASAAIMQEDGSALLISGDVGTRFKPD